VVNVADEVEETEEGGAEPQAREGGSEAEGDESRVAPADIAKAAAVGAVAGAVVGALLRIADGETGSRQLEAVKRTATEAGRDVATAAVGAATEVIARNRIGELIAGKVGNGDRGAAMKSTAKEAGLAAAVAARRVLTEKAGERGSSSEEE
jgi:hypothetical protein